MLEVVILVTFGKEWGSNERMNRVNFEIIVIFCFFSGLQLHWCVYFGTSYNNMLMIFPTSLDYMLLKKKSLFKKTQKVEVKAGENRSFHKVHRRRVLGRRE